MTIKIGGKFINKGNFTSTCPKCNRTISQTNNGEVEGIKCECGYILLIAENRPYAKE